MMTIFQLLRPRYSPSANQRPKACSNPHVLPGFSIIGSNCLLHMAVLSCTIIGRVDLLVPWLHSRWIPDTQHKHGSGHGISIEVVKSSANYLTIFLSNGNLWRLSGGNDVLVNLPTGFGKSFIFQCLLIVADTVSSKPKHAYMTNAKNVNSVGL